MRSHVAFVACILAFAAIGTTAATASAQQRVVMVEEGGGGDWARFRGGVSLIGGGLFVDGLGVGLAGIDGRIGVQLNRLIGIYAQPYLTLGAGKSYGGLQTFVGTGGADAVIDFTLADTLFLGVGGGAGILQNVAAEDILFRIGAYPLYRRGRGGRRRGLMIGIDVRPYFFSDVGQGYNVLNVMGKIGWEAY
jgi:hypothetical protein